MSENKTMTLKEALIERAEMLGWTPDCYTYRGKSWVDFYKIYPTGDRFCFHIEGDNITWNVIDFYEGFDPMEYAVQQYNSRNGSKTIKKLLDVATTIESDLREFADVLDTCEREYEEYVEFGPEI